MCFSVTPKSRALYLEGSWHYGIRIAELALLKGLSRLVKAFESLTSFAFLCGPTALSCISCEASQGPMVW